MFSPSAPHARTTCFTKFFGVLSSFFCFDPFFEPRSFWKFLKPPSSSMRSGMVVEPPFATPRARTSSTPPPPSARAGRISSFAASSVISFPSFTGLTSAVILMASSDRRLAGRRRRCPTARRRPCTRCCGRRGSTSPARGCTSSASSHFLQLAPVLRRRLLLEQRRPGRRSPRRGGTGTRRAESSFSHICCTFSLYLSMHFRIFLAPIFLIMSNLSASRRNRS